MRLLCCRLLPGILIRLIDNASLFLFCCSGFVALVCCSCVSSELAIPGFFRCHSMALRNTFQKTKSIQKSFSPIFSPSGCLRQFSKSCHQRARADRTSCAAALYALPWRSTRFHGALRASMALYAPSMALQPVADIILKTE